MHTGMRDCDTSAGHPADDRRPSAPLPLLPQCDPSPVRSRSMRTARGRHSLIRRSPSERAREGQPLRPWPSRRSFPCPPSRRNAPCRSMLPPVTWPNSRSSSPQGGAPGEPGTPRRIRVESEGGNGVGEAPKPERCAPTPAREEGHLERCEGPIATPVPRTMQRKDAYGVVIARSRRVRRSRACARRGSPVAARPGCAAWSPPCPARHRAASRTPSTG